jgi:metal-responsive CopG/Arc/MetJ family transcriptional regulator
MNMKTAISIETSVYEEAESATRQMGVSRSKLYTLAIHEYVQNHNPEIVTDRLNRIYGKQEAVIDGDIMQAQFVLLSGEDW